jgi:hypothetical protein
MIVIKEDYVIQIMNVNVMRVGRARIVISKNVLVTVVMLVFVYVLKVTKQFANVIQDLQVMLVKKKNALTIVQVLVDV